MQINTCPGKSRIANVLQPIGVRVLGAVVPAEVTPRPFSCPARPQVSPELGEVGGHQKICWLGCTLYWVSSSTQHWWTTFPVPDAPLQNSIMLLILGVLKGRVPM